MATLQESGDVRLRCEDCGHSTRVPLSQTEGRRIVTCTYCGASIYWHECARCGLQYVGALDAGCALCDE